MTTLNQIRSHKPCAEGWTKLLKHLNKTTADDEPLSPITILNSNGLDDAIWCLRTEAAPERIPLFALAVARRVEHLSPEAKTCNEITQRYLNGAATKAELTEAADKAAYCSGAAAYATYAAERAARAARAYATSATYATYAAAYAIRAEAYAAAYATYAAAYATRAEAYAATYATYAAAYATRAEAAERAAQTQIFKEIFE